MTFYKDKTWYLEAAGKLAVTGVKLAGGMGVMGEQTIADMIAALEAEGLNALAEKLMEVSQWKAGLIDANPYPFGSEFGTDSTAEEGAYFFSKMFNNTEAMEKTVDKAIAWKGKSNVWYWQCTGNRQDNDWWLFQYTVGLHGALLSDWYFNNVENPEDYWSMVYPFKYAPFVHIKTSEEQECPGKVGTVWWNYKSTEPYNWDIGFPYCESGEADISLWAGLQIASADVVRDDPSFGTTGYGCIVTDNGETLTVTPQDGLYRRLNVVGAGFQLELLTDRYTEAALPDSDTVNTLTLNLENATDTFEHVTGSHTLTAVFTERIVESELEKIAEALESKTYTVAQIHVNTGAEARAYAQTVIDALLPADVTGTVQAVSFTAAKAGTLLKPEGIDGEYVFTVRLSDGEDTVTTEEITLTIRASEYDAPILPILPGGGSGTTDKPAVQTEFYDVAFPSWYYDAVMYVCENGYMNGVAEGKFDPNGSVTRAMVWTVLARMDGVNTEGGSTWYSKAQAWAMSTGVSDGTDPNGSITREQLAAMLYRFEGSPKVSGSLSAYPDGATVSDWAKDAMVWATQTGLVDGINGNLSPKTGATRAQLATMLMRFTA